jgi:hypothetical protein
MPLRKRMYWRKLVVKVEGNLSLRVVTSLLEMVPNLTLQKKAETILDI